MTLEALNLKLYDELRLPRPKAGKQFKELCWGAKACLLDWVLLQQNSNLKNLPTTGKQHNEVSNNSTETLQQPKLLILNSDKFNVWLWYDTGNTSNINI
jgi:hypothetical protein